MTLRKYTLLTIVVGFFLTSLSLSQTPIVVDATMKWVATGVNVTRGQTVWIAGFGLVNTSKGQPAFWVGPDGLGTPAPSEYTAPGISIYSLVGKIGILGTPFYVGVSRSISATEGGELYLSCNGDPGQFPNYVGHFVAMVANAPSLVTSIIRDNTDDRPGSLTVLQNYPNPFNPGTLIPFNIPSRGFVSIKVYSEVGELVRTLAQSQFEAGSYTVVWDGRNNRGSPVASGIYFYQVQVGDFAQAKKMILLR